MTPRLWFIIAVLLAGCSSQSDESVNVPEVPRAPHHHPHEIALGTEEGRASLQEEPGTGNVLLSLSKPSFDDDPDAEVRLDVHGVLGPMSFDLNREGPRLYSIPLSKFPEEIASLENLIGEVVVTSEGVTWRGEIVHDHQPKKSAKHDHRAAIDREFIILLLVYCTLIVLGSLAGGFLPNRVRLTHRRMQFMVSLIAGLMLGIAIFHLLPHSLMELESRTPPAGPHGGVVHQIEGTVFALEVVSPSGSSLRTLYPLREEADRLERIEFDRVQVTWSDGNTHEARRMNDGKAFRIGRPLAIDADEPRPIWKMTVELDGNEMEVTIGPRGMAPVDIAALCLISGLLVMFFLIRAFHFHHHGDVPLPDGTAVTPGETGIDGAHDHHHDCGGHHHHHDHGIQEGVHRLGWVGIFIGLAIHTLIDGIALGASMASDASHGTLFFGVGTFLAILLHKPLDAVSITTLMTASGWSPKTRTIVNFSFAMMCPLGAILFLGGLDQLAESRALFVGCALAVSAGVFLCISLGDLLPELELHSHDRLWLSLILVVGIVMAWGIGLLEPGHVHHAH